MMTEPQTTSDSGRWTLGTLYKPSAGPCAEHVVEVINPELTLLKEFEVRDVDTGNVLRVERKWVPCVMVRCHDCLKSWSFLEALVLPDEDLLYKGEA